MESTLIMFTACVSMHTPFNYHQSHQHFPISIRMLFLVLPVNVEVHISNQILSCGKLNMYKSAKGEIKPCQGRFSAYKVSGKAPLIHKGCVEGVEEYL